MARVVLAVIPARLVPVGRVEVREPVATRGRAERLDPVLALGLVEVVALAGLVAVPGRAVAPGQAAVLALAGLVAVLALAGLAAVLALAGLAEPGIHPPTVTLTEGTSLTVSQTLAS